MRHLKYIYIYKSFSVSCLLNIFGTFRCHQTAQHSYYFLCTSTVVPATHLIMHTCTAGFVCRNMDVVQLRECTHILNLNTSMFCVLAFYEIWMINFSWNVLVEFWHLHRPPKLMSACLMSWTKSRARAKYASFSVAGLQNTSSVRRQSGMNSGLQETVLSIALFSSNSQLKLITLLYVQLKL